MSGSFKNALDWLILLAGRDPPYLRNKPIGLVSTAGGVQGPQSVTSMEFMVRALRGWSVPLVLSVAQSWQTFDPDGRLNDEMVAEQLRELGAEVVRAARQFQADGTCDYADEFSSRRGKSGCQPPRRPDGPDRGQRCLAGSRYLPAGRDFRARRRSSPARLARRRAALAALGR